MAQLGLIFHKIAEDKSLSPVEKSFLVQWATNAQNAVALVNAMFSGDGNLRAKAVDAGRINVKGGLVLLGEGSFADGFTGTFMAYPAETIDGEDWEIGGLNAGTVQWGGRSSDGKLVAGGGNVILDEKGISFSPNGTEYISWGGGRIYGENSTILQVESIAEDAGYEPLLRLKSRYRLLPTDDTIFLEIDAKNRIFQFVGVGSTEFVINQSGADMNVRMEGNTDPDMFFLDGGNNRLGISTNTPEELFDVDGLSRAQAFTADGDPGSGAASTNRFTGATDSPATDPGWTASSTTDMNAPDGYIKAYVGTQAVVIPYWNT